MGYIIPVLKEKFKNSKIIVLHIDDTIIHLPEIEKHCIQEEIPVLYSTDKTEINIFLEKEAAEIDISNICIIEWRPSLMFFKEAYISLFSQVVNFLKRSDAGNRTAAFFGKRWVKNFFRNLKITESVLVYRQTSIPVIITGSGPSLEQDLPVINRMQENCLIIAASSSVLALSLRGIQADIVIATDGSAWALRHIYHVLRDQPVSDNSKRALALNFCAALPSQSKNSSFLIINDGSLWQNIIFHELGLPSVMIAQKGTVCAVAAELALLLTSGNIYLAGMDFSVNDIRTHVKPYPFDNIFFGQANRFLPVYSTLFTRSKLLNEGGSMDIYAAWFKDQYILWPKRIFPFSGIKSEKQNYKKNPDNIFKTVNIKDESSLYKKGIESLLSAMDDPKYSDNLIKELEPLLLSGKKNAAKAELKTALREAANA